MIGLLHNIVCEILSIGLGVENSPVMQALATVPRAPIFVQETSPHHFVLAIGQMVLSPFS